MEISIFLMRKGGIILLHTTQHNTINLSYPILSYPHLILMEESSHSTQSSKQNPPFQEDLRSGTGNPDIDHAVSFWKQFDLTTARAQWDKICNDMREMKTASISGRKRLNDLTKSFRAKSREEQTSQVQDLVKAYQEEIDQLSRRSKLSEVSFFDLHKSLYDAPDPGFFLEQLLHTSLHSNSHVLEIEKLKAELAQYDDEFQRLKNQEVTIRRLEDQLTDFQQRNEVKVEEEVERRVDLIRQQCQEEVLEAKEMQKATERRLSVALEAVKQAQSQSERCQAQLLEVSEKYENKLSAMMSENSLLAENIQRLQLRCSEMESENDHLKKGAVVIATSSATSSPHPKSDSADLAFSADRQTSLELLVAQLRGQVQEKEEQVRQERLVADAALREAQLLYAKEKEQLARARQELQSRPSPRDVTALRRRLRLVEKIAFHGARADRGEGRGEDDVEEEMEEHDGDGDDVAPENHSVPLENLLTAKILGLERDVTALRRQNLDLTETQSSQTDVIASLKQTLEHRQQALARAERELEARNALLERMMKEQSAKKENALTSLEDLLADVTSPPPLSVNNQAASHSLPSREGGGGDDVAEASSQMIAILTNQRDRYKERLTQVSLPFITSLLCDVMYDVAG